MHLHVSIALALLATTPTLAATITVRPQAPDRPIVVILEGPLVEDDEDRFATKTASLASAFVAFSSDGGNLATGASDWRSYSSEGLFHDRSRQATLRLCVCISVARWHRALSGDGCQNRFSCCFKSRFCQRKGHPPVLTKIGLPYEAILYITQAAPNEMTWLNMSDAAQRGIRVTLLSSLAKETAVAIPTRYGDITVTRDDPECCNGNIRYGDQRIEIASTGQIYASLDGIYKVGEGDLVIISSPSGAIGSPARHYYVLLVGQDGMTDKSEFPNFRWYVQGNPPEW
jgi:hypothetical protein